MLFVDSALGARIVERLRVLSYKNVAEVNFGGKSPDEPIANGSGPGTTILPA
jgi:hypothetical protein